MQVPHNLLMNCKYASAQVRSSPEEFMLLWARSLRVLHQTFSEVKNNTFANNCFGVTQYIRLHVEMVCKPFHE